MIRPALIWFRRDARLTDNPALNAALERHRTIIPVYIHAPDEDGAWPPGAVQRVWLHHSLKSLARGIAVRGSRLIIRRGASLDTLRALVRQTGAAAVYWNRLYEPDTLHRDRRIKQVLRQDGLAAESFNAALLHEPWEMATGRGEPYRVFTPFWRQLGRREVPAPLPQPETLPAVGAEIQSLTVDDMELLPGNGWHTRLERRWHVGESGAQHRLTAFLDRDAHHYSRARDYPALEATSGLSPHLHFGEISPRQIWQACANTRHGRDNMEAFLRQLGWREFAHHVLYHFPQCTERPLDRRFLDFPWAEDHTAALTAWQRAETGIPMVDAAMRQLWETGWMHNRLRMTVASLLTKNLRIPWQKGTQWFWHTLADADLANNTLGWQWSAGCGADAAPYFRILNPVRQGERFDPRGDYVRRWLPELGRLPERHIHAPWTAGEGELRKAGLRLGSNYPRPIVDLKATRQAALAAYQHIRTGR